MVHRLLGSRAGLRRLREPGSRFRVECGIFIAWFNQRRPARWPAPRGILARWPRQAARYRNAYFIDSHDPHSSSTVARLDQDRNILALVHADRNSSHITD